MPVMETARNMKESISRTRVAGKTQDVEFALYAPAAKKVSVAGTFNDWDMTAMVMKKSKDGTWRIKVRLSPGKYEYKYYVDGGWAQDIPGAALVPNPFGTSNCVIAIQ